MEQHRLSHHWVIWKGWRNCELMLILLFFIEIIIWTLLNYMHSILSAGYWGTAVLSDPSLNIYGQWKNWKTCKLIILDKKRHILCVILITFVLASLKMEIGLFVQEWVWRSAKILTYCMISSVIYFLVNTHTSTLTHYQLAWLGIDLWSARWEGRCLTK